MESEKQQEHVDIENRLVVIRDRVCVCGRLVKWLKEKKNGDNEHFYSISNHRGKF